MHFNKNFSVVLVV